MPNRHLDLPLLESFAAVRLRPREMLRAGRHLSTCAACRVRFRREVDNGREILQRLHLEDPQATDPREYEELFERLCEGTADRVQKIEHEKSLVPLLLRELSERPAGEQDLIVQGESRFRTAAFVEALLEKARSVWAEDQFRSEAFATLALEIANRLDHTVYGYGLINDLKARSWGFIANARRIHADLKGAEAAFKEAETMLLEGSGDPLESVRLLDLKASLRRAQRRFEEALDLLDEVAAICRKVREIHLEGRALIGKALIYDYADAPEKAVPLLFDALAKIDRRQEPRLLWTILQNLTLSLIALGEYEKAATLLPDTKRAAFEVGTADDVTRTLWVEGLLDLGTRRFAEAESKLEAVRNHYAGLGIGYNAALASLDLAKVYLLQGRTEETKRLAEEMHPIFVSRDVQRETIAALLVFQQAIVQETATLRLIDEVIRKVKEAQANPQARPERPA